MNVKHIPLGGSTNRVFRFLRQNLVPLGILVLAIVTFVAEPRFMSQENMTNVMKQMGVLSFVALGMTFVILGGFIDLSVVGIISLVGFLTVHAIDSFGQVGAIIFGVLLGGLLGYINGKILTLSGAMTQAEVLFITYGMSSVYMAMGLLLAGAETIRISNSEMPYTIFTALGSGTLFGVIPIALAFFIVLLILMHLFHTKTLAGRSISLVGGNKDAAYLCGFNVRGIMCLIYTISGLMSALGGIMLASRSTVANATLGIGYETNAILCVVVGGTTLKGGKGSVLRTMLGVLLITLLGNCMNMLGLSTFMQTIMRGTVLVVAIWLDNRREV